MTSQYAEKASYDCQLPPPLPPGHDRATACVYRLYNDTDPGPFYIGSAYDPRKRLAHHRSHKAWWWRVHHFTIEWFPDRAAADLAEHTAIYTEQPSANQAGRSRVYQPTRHPRPAPLNMSVYHTWDTTLLTCQRCLTPWLGSGASVCPGAPPADR